MVKNSLGQYFSEIIRLYRSCTKELLEKFKDHIVDIEYPTMYDHRYIVVISHKCELQERLTKDIALVTAKYYPIVKNLKIRLDEPEV